MSRKPLFDADYLQKLQDYYARHRVFPAYALIARIVGLKSTSSVAALLGRLKAAGYLEAKERRLRPGDRFFERPLMPGRIAAGAASMAFDAPPAARAIDAHLIRHPSRTFLLVIKGDSMVDAGLLPGDTAVVERANTAQHGDIVVAAVDEGYTIKRLVSERGRFVLKPENKAYPVLRPHPLEIVGLVVASYRSYR